MPLQATVKPKTIMLQGDLHRRHEEYRADAALSPGHLVTKNATEEVLKHATAGAAVATTGALYIAKEDGLIGKTINDAYATGDLVPCHSPRKGDHLYMRVAAAAVAIVYDDRLTSDGAGGLKKANGTTDVPLCVALEALDNSGGSADAFIRVEWIK